MKKLFLIITILFSILIPAVSADGMFHVQDEDMWNLFNEEQQFCAINYNEGIQNMILTINPSGELSGDKAVWIFPVPSKPDKIVVNIIKSFPKLFGHNVLDQVEMSISDVFLSMRLTQIYTLPFWFIKYTLMSAGENFSGLEVHETINSMGLTTELVSAVNGSSLEKYITLKGLNLPNSSISILDEYTGQDYSFVISWISDIEKFNQKQEEFKKGNDIFSRNSIGVFITFPTDKIYYPLKPTSVYGSKKVPAVIYVLDHVEPELYDGIKPYTETNYFFEYRTNIPEELRDFFAGYNLESSPYYLHNDKEEGFSIKDIKYTKIKINSPSKYLTQDLWIERSIPKKIKAANFINRFKLLFGLIFFILCSCLASLLSGIIIFRDRPISKIKITLFGLWNFLTLIGFSIAVYISKITKSQENQQSNVPFRKIITRTLLISILILVFLFLIFTDFLRFLYFEIFIFIFIMYIIGTALIAPFVFIYYKSRKTMMFIILFTVFFIFLTFLSQIFLSVII